MTVNQFALATGFHPEYIRNACRKGKIPCHLWLGQYEIPEKLVPLWKSKKNRYHKKGGQTIHNDLYLYQRALDEYKRKNKKYLSYGQAVAMGVITDEQT